MTETEHGDGGMGSAVWRSRDGWTVANEADTQVGFPKRVAKSEFLEGVT